MADSDNAPSKKRAAGRELSRDNPGLDDEEDNSELEKGTFKRASEEVLATRKIVKVRRSQTTSTTLAPSFNPFAGIRLVPPSEADPSQATTGAQPASETCVSVAKLESDANQQSDTKPESVALKKSDVKEEEKVTIKATEPGVADDKNEAGSAAVKENVVKESSNISSEPAVGEDTTKADVEAENKIKTVTDGETEKTENEEKIEKKDDTDDPSTEGAPLSSFQQLSSSQNAFTNLSGTGFSTSTFSFGLISKDGPALSTGSGSLFGSKSDLSAGLGLSNNRSSSLFATAGPSVVPKSDTPAMQVVAVETGEENEKAVFTADAVLFEFIDKGWKERGKGDLKVNVSESGDEKARLVMRAKGIRKVILNASIYPDMKLANMEKKGVTFACMNSIDEKEDGLSTFALKFKDGSIVEEFRSAVTEHKGKTATAMKTPENSPK